MLKRFFALVMIVSFIFGCVTTKNVQYEQQKVAQLDIKGIQRVAVADFDGLHQTGRIIAFKIAAGIVDTGKYRLFEREKLAEILKEHDLYKSDSVDKETIKKLQLNGVDALIFGVVDIYNIDDQLGVTKVTKKVGTGRFEEVEYEEDGEKKTRKEEIMKTVLWDRPYIRREGTVGVTFRMSNIVTGEVVAVEAMTANYSGRAWEDEAQKLPTKEKILDDLANEVVEKFLNKIQPHRVMTTVAFEATSEAHNKLAMKYASNQIWDKALEEFEKSKPYEKNKETAYYNLAMVYYILGEYAKAERNIEEAIRINPKDKYVEALARIRDDR